MKIHIIGCSGTGKTYLARKLSKKYNIQHYDLDDIQWDNSMVEIKELDRKNYVGKKFVLKYQTKGYYDIRPSK